VGSSSGANLIVVRGELSIDLSTVVTIGDSDAAADAAAVKKMVSAPVTALITLADVAAMKRNLTWRGDVNGGEGNGVEKTSVLDAWGAMSEQQVVVALGGGGSSGSNSRLSNAFIAVKVHGVRNVGGSPSPVHVQGQLTAVLILSHKGAPSLPIVLMQGFKHENAQLAVRRITRKLHTLERKVADGLASVSLMGPVDAPDDECKPRGQLVWGSLTVTAGFGKAVGSDVIKAFTADISGVRHCKPDAPAEYVLKALIPRLTLSDAMTVTHARLSLLLPNNQQGKIWGSVDGFVSSGPTALGTFGGRGGGGSGGIDFWLIASRYSDEEKTMGASLGSDGSGDGDSWGGSGGSGWTLFSSPVRLLRAALAADATSDAIATTWMTTSFTVDSATGCTDMGSTVVGTASVNLAWLDSVGTLAGDLTGYRRCGHDATAAGDEYWALTVTAAKATLAISSAGKIAVSMSGIVVMLSGLLPTSLNTAASKMTWAVTISGTVDDSDVEQLTGFAVADLVASSATNFAFTLTIIKHMLIGPDVTSDEALAASSTAAQVVASMTSEYATWEASGSLSAIPCKTGDSISAVLRYFDIGLDGVSMEGNASGTITFNCGASSVIGTVAVSLPHITAGHTAPEF